MGTRKSHGGGGERGATRAGTKPDALHAEGVPRPRGAVRRGAALAALALTLAACGKIPFLSRSPTSAGSFAESYTLLPDTTMCVVDRTTARGLRQLRAKRSEQGQVVLRVGGELLSLDELHPVRAGSGYGGNEPWFARNEAIRHAGRRYDPVPGERRVAPEQLRLLGEHAAVPLFGDPNEKPPPQAVYVPVRPGCVFRAYVRADLLR